MIIDDLKNSNLKGRGGADYPTYQKWAAVLAAAGSRKYIICNAAEGEPGVFKDGFILEKFPDAVVDGIKCALETIDNSKAYIYLRKDYFRKFKNKLNKLIEGFPITLVKENGGYLCGEETTLIESIEGNRQEPREKPPFPTESGLFGCPTLINNVETFYFVSKIKKGDYHNTRFYSISQEQEKKGVFELPAGWTVRKILDETGNMPKGKFFVQMGGAASGSILTQNELETEVAGSGAIITYNYNNFDILTLIGKWVDFFYKENCGKCVPCREGVFRIREMIKKKKINRADLDDILFVLDETSFCPLGKGVAVPINGAVNKLWLKK